jgi:F0F1-type ATP synthase assembly protein I
MAFFKDKRAKGERKRVHPGLSLGMNFAGGMAICAGMGYWLDQKLGTDNVWVLVGSFLGMAYCGYEMWKVIQWMNAEEEKANAARKVAEAEKVAEEQRLKAARKAAAAEKAAEESPPKGPPEPPSDEEPES